MTHPLILKQRGNVLLLTTKTIEELSTNPRPILWCNDGLYGMIPIERIKNLLSVFQDRQYCKKAFRWHFVWNDAVEIPQETGKVMFECNRKSPSE